MPNPTTYVPPEWAWEQDKKDNPANYHSFEYWQEIAAADSGDCEVCESEKAWKYGGTGMCFTCTTGEADASQDYELMVGAPWPKAEGR